MKNVQQINGGAVRRVTDGRAEKMVRSGHWRYAPKKTKDEAGNIVPLVPKSKEK